MHASTSAHAASAAPVVRGTARDVVRFVLHYVEMVLAMVVGMVVLGVPVGLVAGAAGIGDLHHELPLLGIVVMTATMTGPMAGWMAVRGHGRRMIGEMSLAMVLPAAGLLVLGAVGVLEPLLAMRLLDPLMYVAMLVVMLVRRDHVLGH